MATLTPYVPVLRWKQAEWMALRYLHEQIRELIAPVVEIPPSRFRLRKNETHLDVDDRLRETAEQLSEDWGTGPFFLDLHLLQALETQVPRTANLFSSIAPHFLDNAMPMIPVVTLEDDPSFLAEVRNGVSDFHEVGLRVRASSLDSGFEHRATEALESLEIEPEQVHLIVDFGYVDQDATGIYEGVTHRLLWPERWRTVTFLGGAFPRDLQGFGVGVHSVQRHEWRAWRLGIFARKAELTRAIGFGDYTIQHPNFSEPPRWSNPSASVRYAADESWLIFRGEGLRTSDLKNQQYIGQAILISDHSTFCGADFSYGDDYISEIANSQDKTGSPMTWLRAGINHHMTLATRQVASLLS